MPDTMPVMFNHGHHTKEISFTVSNSCMITFIGLLFTKVGHTQTHLHYTSSTGASRTTSCNKVNSNSCESVTTSCNLRTGVMVLKRLLTEITSYG